MNKLSLVILLLLSVNLFSQDQDKSFDLKLYTNYDYTPRYLNNSADTVDGITRTSYEKEINGFNFSPAIAFYNKKGNSSEIEISRLSYTNNYNKEYDVLDSDGSVINTISGEYQKQFALHLRYEYKIHLFKKKDWKKIKAIIGFSGSPFIQWNKVDPLLPTEFSKSNMSVGIFASVIPRVEYNINEQWYLDLNVPVALLTAYYHTTTDNNPAIEADKRTNSTIDFYNGPINFAIRLGVGYRI